MDKDKILSLFKEITDEYYDAEDMVIDERSTEFINDQKELANKIANWEERLRLLLNDGWISVKDRLPEPNKVILLYSPKHGVFAGEKATGCPYWSDDKGYDSSVLGFDEITHWQPLPEPSEVESC